MGCGKGGTHFLALGNVAVGFRGGLPISSALAVFARWWRGGGAGSSRIR